MKLINFSCSGEPQWERPAEFVPIVRENPFTTTPEQEFIKSVLSPKRSKVGYLGRANASMSTFNGVLYAGTGREALRKQFKFAALTSRRLHVEGIEIESMCWSWNGSEY